VPQTRYLDRSTCHLLSLLVLRPLTSAAGTRAAACASFTGIIGPRTAGPQAGVARMRSGAIIALARTWP
jgi:hypothetical protein